MNPLIPIVTILLMNLLTACETNDPGKETEGEEEKEAVPTFTYRIVDYSRAPNITGSPAIDPIFYCSEIDDPEGNGGQYPYYWTGTTHLDGSDPESAAVYIAFGEAQGWMHDQLMDVHGAGAQRSDPKSGDPGDYPSYWGPQGDVRCVYNYVRCVRDIPLK